MLNGTGDRFQNVNQRGPGFLPGMLVGFFCASLAFLSAWFTFWNRSPVPFSIGEKLIEADMGSQDSTTPVSESRIPTLVVKKMFTERIEPAGADLSTETRALGVPQRSLRRISLREDDKNRCKLGRFKK